MRSPFDLIAHRPEAQGTGNTAVAGRRSGRRVRRDARRDFGEHQPQGRHRRNRVPDAVARGDHRVRGRDQRLQARVRPGRRRRRSRSRRSPARTRLQGSVYGFFRDDALDKKGFFEATKGIYKQSDDGGSLGGPVSDSGLYNGRNRTFFFASYEGFYNEQGSNAAFRSVPTPEMWNGDFSNWVDSQRPAHDDLRSGDDAAESEWRGIHPRSVPRQQDSGRAVQHSGEAVHRAGAVGRHRAQSARRSCRARSATSTTTTCPKGGARSRRRTSTA